MQRQRHHQRHQQHELADDSGHQHQWHKCGDGGGHRRQHRQPDFADGAKRRGQGLGAARDAVIDGLGDDHRVVHQHAQRNDDAEQHRDAEGEIEGIQDGECARQRKRNPEADQQRQPAAEEQPAQSQHDQQADQRIGFHHADGVPGRHGLVVEQHQRKAARFQRRLAFGDGAVDVGHQVQRVDLALLGYRQDHRGLAVGGRQAAGSRARGLRRRHCGQRHRRPQPRRQHRQPRQVIGVGLLADHPHQPVVLAHPRAPGEGVAEPVAHRVGDLRGGEAARGRFGRGELHPQLGVALAGGHHPVDPGQALDVVLDLSRGAAQALIVGGAGQQHHRRRKAVRRSDFLNVGLPRVVRQVAVVLVLHQSSQVGDVLVELAFRHLAEAHQDNR